MSDDHVQANGDSRKRTVRKARQLDNGTWVMRAEDVPYGYCHCGCGGKTNLAPYSDARRGYVKGQPYKFIAAHGGSRGSKSPDLASVFFHRVDKRGSNECWEWQGSRTVAGYGKLQHETVTKMAHRVAYEFAHGQIPDGEVVRHKCDNPPCCNPAHLETGSYGENMQDAVERDRMSRGEAHVFAVLTEQAVREIRAKYDRGVSISAMAREYGVVRGTIRNVIQGKTWRRVA